MSNFPTNENCRSSGEDEIFSQVMIGVVYNRNSIPFITSKSNFVLIVSVSLRLKIEIQTKLLIQKE